MPNIKEEKSEKTFNLLATLQAAATKIGLTYGVESISKKLQDHKQPIHSMAERKQIIFGKYVNGSLPEKIGFLYRGAIPWGVSYKMAQLTTLAAFDPIQEAMKKKLTGHPIASDVASSGVITLIQTPLLQFLSNMKTAQQAGNPPNLRILSPHLVTDLKAFPWKSYLFRNIGITGARNFCFFNTLGIVRSAVQHSMASPDQELTPTQKIAASGIGVAAAMVTTAPLDIVKTRKQLLLVNHPPVSSYQMALSIVKKEGIKGFYKGFAPNFAMELTGVLLFFGLQSAFSKKGLHENNDYPAKQINSTKMMC